MRLSGESQAGSKFTFILRYRLADPDASVPAALQYEKFLIPDALRVVDALVETLSY
jgi:hypothetical protein